MARNSLVVNCLGQTNTSVRSDSDLLSQGRDLIHAVESRKGWLRIDHKDVSLPEHSGQMLVFKEPPPRIAALNHEQPTTSDERPNRSKLWNLTDISKLKPFETAGYRHLLKQKPRTSELCNREHRSKKHPREGLDEEQGQRERKRRKTDVDHLYDLVALPHYHANLTVATDPSTDITKRFAPYAKATLVPTHPYSDARVKEYLEDVYARAAWIIPIRGAMPWEDATSANLTNDETLFPTLSRKAGISSRTGITWAPTTVKKFWEDLLEIRKRGTMGPISLSYHISAKDGIDEEATTKKLSSCTYIKLYHDVRYSLHVRAVLDAWQMELPSAAAASEQIGASNSGPSSRAVTKSVARPTRVRPLLGAKLVLLDETSQAIGIC